nr:aldo/keto reductase [Kofleriaceae bacterium]
MTAALGCQHVAGADVVRAAIDAGVRLLDTADVYGTEAMIGELRVGPEVELVTKGGLVIDDGVWRPDGRAGHLAAAARASRDRLGRVDLYLLHAVGPRVPLDTSVRALAKLVDDGVVATIGLANVTVTQLAAALAIAPIAAVQIEVSPWRCGALRDGTVAAMRKLGVRVLASKPFGGATGAKRIAKLGLSHEVVLAWLRAHGVTPLPGATRIDTARSCGRVWELAAAELAELDRRWLADDAAVAPVPAHAMDVVIICGGPGSGKSTLAHDYVARGYARLNRDDRGGTLAALAKELDRTLTAGATRVVLDNTYPTRSSRAPVIAAARRHGAAARCVVVDVPLERAQCQAAARMLAQHGRLLEPAEIAADPTAVGPSVLFRFQRQWEPPRDDEGFASIEHVAPEVRAMPGTKRGLIVELDHVVWRGRPRRAGDVVLVDGAAQHLAAWAAAGYTLAATTWQPGVDDATFAAITQRLRELLAIELPVVRCSHPAGPPVCWCRKPLPGMGVVLAHAHDLDLARTTHVGSQAADRGFAQRLGVRYISAEAWSGPE